MLTFAEMYERLHLNGWSDAQRAEASEELATMSDLDWSDWIEYRNTRMGKTTEQS